jgi:hypothetical protein
MSTYLVQYSMMWNLLSCARIDAFSMPRPQMRMASKFSAFIGVFSFPHHVRRAPVSFSARRPLHAQPLKPIPLFSLFAIRDDDQMALLIFIAAKGPSCRGARAFSTNLYVFRDTRDLLEMGLAS